MIAVVHDEGMRAAFEAYIRTDRPRERLERNNPNFGMTNDYKDLFVQEAWEAWRAAKAGQARLAVLEAPPAIPVPSHVHCQCCGEPKCPGVQVREALPLVGPAPEQIRRIRMEGRNEALELLTNFSAEKFIDQYFGEHAIADTGDHDVHWETDKLRELLEIGEYPESMIDRLEAAYWTQQAFIDGLQVQLSEEWLPIEAAGGDKDGRYILGWFPDRPRSQKINPDDAPEPWVAAVRWSGNEFELWGMLGSGGLMPTKFRRITGPDGKPVGYIRPPGGRAP